MREHRLIERMIGYLRVEMEKIKEKKLDGGFIDQAVDFSKTYADRTHRACQNTQTNYGRTHLRARFSPHARAETKGCALTF